jgi:hypothetical protein
LELGRAPAKRDNRRCVIVEQQQNTTNTSTTVDECNGIQFYLGGSGSNLRMNKKVSKMDKQKRDLHDRRSSAQEKILIKHIVSMEIPA